MQKCYSFLLLFIISSLWAQKEERITMPSRMQEKGVVFLLNGMGVRTFLGIKIYYGGLYLLAKSTDPVAICTANDPMIIRLKCVSGLVTKERMVKTTRKGFIKSTKNNLAPIRKKIDLFLSVFKEKIKINDIFTFIYIPDQGTEVYKNGTLLLCIQGLAFKKALFGIWLCEQPAQVRLKNDMLGIK